MITKKALIITYYWPPAGGPGVQRWLKFTKYLPDFGIEPIIYTPENPSYPIIDKTLEQEVSSDLKIIKTKIREPYAIAELINSGNKKYKAGQFNQSEKQSFTDKISIFIRGNFFIPDARKFWVKPSVNFLKNYLSENPVDTVITTGPPHSLHLIGLELKKTFPELNWLADFRDPWTQISYHSQLKLTKSSEKKHFQLEVKVLQSCDCVIATSFTDAENYKKSGAKKVEVITNGYEESDFENLEKKISEKFRITYSGGLEMARNPLVVWKALKELSIENSDFKKDLELNFCGNISDGVKDSIEENGLNPNCVFSGYITHKQSIIEIKNSNLLLLTNFPDDSAKGIIPGKLFEYMATQNQILSVGPDGGDVEKILNENRSGKHFNHFDKENIKEFIIENYKKFKKSESGYKINRAERYTRKSLTCRLAELI